MDFAMWLFSYGVYKWMDFDIYIGGESFPRIEEEKLALVQVNQKGRKPDMNMIKGG